MPDEGIAEAHRATKNWKLPSRFFITELKAVDKGSR